jgi:hypothetical protein
MLSDPSGMPGTIFYTTNGSDPQPPDGVITTETILLDQGAPATALIPSETNGGSGLSVPEWTTTSDPPNSANWLSGTTGIGYAYDGLVGLDVAAMKGQNPSAYTRIPFDIPDQPTLDHWNRLTLRMKFEDGFIAYLNGTKVGEFQAPATPAWDSTAAGSHPDAEAIQFVDFDISAHLDLLQVGANLLAIHVLNSSVGSSDLLAMPQLVAAELSVSVPGAVAYTTPLTLGASTTIRARILSDSGDWSAINEATFITGTPATASNLVVSEIMYHPPDPGAAAEFIELQNISTTEAIDLTQVAFTAGIAYTFPTGTTLAPGEQIVVSGSDFGDGTRLANGGEQIILSAADDTAIRDFRYDDQLPWPEAPDGDGFSLTLMNPTSNPDHSDPANWRRSAAAGGSPGGSDTIEFVGDPQADGDGDGTPALLEHFFGTSDSLAGGSPVTFQLDSDGGLLVEFPRDAGADDFSARIESSADLVAWFEEDAILEAVTPSPPTPRERWRLEPGSGHRKFLRIRVVR